MKAYSQDLRLRILMAVDDGMEKSNIARIFNVGRATVKRYVAQRRDTGNVEPKPKSGRPAVIPAKQHEALVTQLKATPDATLAEHSETWRRTYGVRVTVTTMHRTIMRTGWTRKKDDCSYRA